MAAHLQSFAMEATTAMAMAMAMVVIAFDSSRHDIKKQQQSAERQTSSVEEGCHWRGRQDGDEKEGRGRRRSTFGNSRTRRTMWRREDAVGMRTGGRGVVGCGSGKWEKGTPLWWEWASWSWRARTGSGGQMQAMELCQKSASNGGGSRPRGMM